MQLEFGIATLRVWFLGGGWGGGGTGDLDRCTYPLQIQPTGLHDLGKLGGDDMIDVFFESR